MIPPANPCRLKWSKPLITIESKRVSVTPQSNEWPPRRCRINQHLVSNHKWMSVSSIIKYEICDLHCCGRPQLTHGIQVGTSNQHEHGSHLQESSIYRIKFTISVYRRNRRHMLCSFLNIIEWSGNSIQVWMPGVSCSSARAM